MGKPLFTENPPQKGPPLCRKFVVNAPLNYPIGPLPFPIYGPTPTFVTLERVLSKTFVRTPLEKFLLPIDGVLDGFRVLIYRLKTHILPKSAMSLPM